MRTDLAVIVTAHDETAVCGPTMRAADLAIEAARERGLTVQAVIGLDTPTEATSAYFHQPHFDHWERQVLHEGEPSGVRSALVHRCDGRYIAFLSAYDLCSENWLTAGVAAMEASVGRGEHVIAHPELTVTFDGQKLVHLNIEQNSRLFTSHLLYFRDYYDSACLATRDAHLEIPYVSRDLTDGLPYQDPQFTIETMGRGWRHITVTDTIIFKRRRDRPGVGEGDGSRSIVAAPPEMAIDRIRDLGSAPR
jgi:hypothetical protein